MKKIALIGGAFDPVTTGHLQLAEVVRKHVDEVWLLPCFDHAYGKEMATAEHRLAMCDVAIASHFWVGKKDLDVKASNFEIHHKTSTTFDTLEKLRAERPNDYYFVVGQDNADTIDKWYNHKELLRTTKFIVVPRRGYASSETWYHEEPHLYLEDEEVAEVSSTQVRELLKVEDPAAADFLTQEVYNHIKKHELYK